MKAKPAKKRPVKATGTKTINVGSKLKLKVPADNFQLKGVFKGKSVQEAAELIQGSLKGAEPYVKRGGSWQPLGAVVEEKSVAAPAEMPAESVAAAFALPETRVQEPGGAQGPGGALALGASLSDPRVRRPMIRSALPTIGGVSWSGLKKHALSISESMDLRPQVALARARMGVPRMALASAAANELPVIARVTDVAAWEALSEVRVGANLGLAAEGSTTLVTGRIPVMRIEAVRQQPFVLSLKASQPVRPALAETTREIGARPNLFPADAAPAGGKGVVIGIIDFGCDFAHRNFQNADGSSRIQALWHQAGIPTPNSPIGYGRVYTKADIDAALPKRIPTRLSATAHRPTRLSSAAPTALTSWISLLATAAGRAFQGVRPRQTLCSSMSR